MDLNPFWFKSSVIFRTLLIALNGGLTADWSPYIHAYKILPCSGKYFVYSPYITQPAVYAARWSVSDYQHDVGWVLEEDFITSAIVFMTKISHNDIRVSWWTSPHSTSQIISGIQLIKLWETNLPSPDEFLPCNVLVPYTRAASVTKWRSTESMLIANYSCHCLSLITIWNACVMLNKSPGILYGGMGDCNSIFFKFKQFFGASDVLSGYKTLSWCPLRQSS